MPVRLLALLLVLVVGCAPLPEGLRLTPPGSGPQVRVDWDAEPLPDIPFPNDLATRPDPRSPTGLRLNLPTQADIALERQTRALLNELSGFGIFAPILVGFDGRLDLDEILARHPDDLHDPQAFADDAILLIDVQPGSPTFLQPVPIEIGHGRFPQDAARLGMFFPNDPRADQPSLLFDTVDEDLNGNGILDPGEDTDGDGLLDVANVWPPGGDPRADLLTWYDLQSNTLHIRPVVPLREETRYAVVLTEALVDGDGQPVRSPWEYVHHTRQTEALRPAVRALEKLGRGVDDIAFAWTFTTGRITRDLWDVTEGLRGRGPLSQLAADFPPGIVEGHELHTRPAVADPLSLPVELLVPAFDQIGLIPASSIDYLTDAYLAFTDRIVGGAFVAPDLLYDRDDQGRDDSDEHWVVDPARGFVEAAPRRIAFSCAIPKARGENQPPWPVVIHTHGYGSSRVELVFFAHALNRVGIAVCGFDTPGQGLAFSEGESQLIAGVLSLSGAAPLWWHLVDNRVRDLDNDGLPDAAGDSFPADAFHARDVLRQSALDATQLIRSLQACGQGTMERVELTSDGPVGTGEQVVSCDWDGDGVPDLGGPDTRFALHGVSHGGIMTSLSIAVQEADTAVVTVPGGGLADIVGRTEISSVADGMVGRALTPLVLGLPTSDGGVRVVQLVVTVDRTAILPVARLDRIPAGGSVIVRNLALGKEASGPIPEDGRFRVPIAANAPDAAEKALLTGIPPGGVRYLETYGTPDNLGLGDPLEIEVLDARGRTVQVIDRFEEPVTHEGVTYEAGSPLVAGGWGLGLRRGSKELQRLVSVLAIAVEPGDPIAYARRWADDPFADPKRVLVHLTAGDSLVPISTGLALARAAGLVDFERIDPRYGTTADRFLIDRGVVQGLEQFGPWKDPEGRPILFDPDDLDNGTDGTGAPSESPLRAERPNGLALRILYVDPRGSHAYMLPDASLAFDWPLFGAQQMAWYLASGGEITDDPCLATRDCPFLPAFPEAE